MIWRAWLIGLCVVLGNSCTVQTEDANPEEFTDTLVPASRYVKERVALTNPANASISELALSVPIYVSDSIEGFIAMGAVQAATNSTGTEWALGGDGAQRAVFAKRLSAPGQTPVMLEVVTGNIPPEDLTLATRYDMVHVDGGWRILQMKAASRAVLMP